MYYNILFMIGTLIIIFALSPVWGMNNSTCSNGMSCVPKCPEIKEMFLRTQDANVPSREKQKMQNIITARRCQGTKFCCETRKNELTGT